MKGSMLSAEIAEPYAEALMSLAQSQNQVDRFGEDVRSLLSLLDSSPDLQEFLGNPVLSAENKKAVLRQIAGDGLHPTILNFLMLLVDRRRIIFIEGVCNTSKRF
jgi:F-type H+-transporting ATPase subunit delta